MDTANKEAGRLAVAELRSKVKKYKLILLGIGAGVFFSVLSLAQLNTNPEDARYILSAISQGLAAILALVFTITLVAVQITRKYTAMDKILFKQEIIILMAVFGLGIILPLLALKFEWWCIGVNISIAIAAFCVFSLYFLLRDVSDVLKEIGIEKLTEEAGEAIDERHEITAQNRIEELGEIGREAAEKNHEDKVREVISRLRNLGDKAIGNRLRGATYSVVDWLGKVGEMAAKKRLNGKEWRGLFIGGEALSAIWSALEALRELGKSVAETDGMESETRHATDCITKVGIKAMEMDLENDTIAEAIYSLSEVSKRATERKLEWLGAPIIIQVVKNNFVEFCERAIKKEHEYCTKRIVVHLWIVCAVAMKSSIFTDRQSFSSLKLMLTVGVSEKFNRSFAEGYEDAKGDIEERKGEEQFHDLVHHLEGFRRRFEEN